MNREQITLEALEAALAEIERLRAALKWLRPYVAGTSVYGKVHALDKIDAALEQKSP
jgi:hypothetical protein